MLKLFMDTTVRLTIAIIAKRLGATVAGGGAGGRGTFLTITVATVTITFIAGVSTVLEGIVRITSLLSVVGHIGARKDTDARLCCLASVPTVAVGGSLLSGLFKCKPKYSNCTRSRLVGFCTSDSG